MFLLTVDNDLQRSFLARDPSLAVQIESSEIHKMDTWNFSGTARKIDPTWPR